MNVQVRNALIGFGLVFGISFGLGMLGVRGLPMYSIALPVGAVSWLILSNLSGNRKVQIAPDADRRAALAAGPAAGLGLLYVHRDGYYGRALGFDVALDGAVFAQLKSPTFTRLEVPTGVHLLSADVNGFAKSQVLGSVVRFEIGAGETHVYLLTQQFGMIQGRIQITQEGDPGALLAKLATVPMVVAETAALAALSTANPPPPFVGQPR